MSDSMNHPEQPKVCCVCGEKIKKSDGDAQYYYDDTKARQHWSKHNKCVRAV